MKKILFSPVGSTDPIAGQRDGALLHIARIYRPDKIYLYLSREMCELEEKDCRYTYCLQKLSEKLGKGFDITLIKRPQLTEVHIFDEMLEELQHVLDDVIEKESQEAFQMYLNVSSGTPAMKSALQLIATMTQRRLIPLQVASPNGAYNEHREDIKGEYSVELQWELNEDNGESFESRCTVSSNINMAARIKKEIIKKHIRVYDYVAAVQVAEGMQDFIDENTLNLIKAGEVRLMMDTAAASKLADKASYSLLPHRGGEECKIFEYLALENIKLKRKEYMDFIRGISPLFANVLVRILKRNTNFDFEKYTYTKKDDWKRGINTLYWKQGASTDNWLISCEIYAFDNRFVSTDAIVRLLETLIADRSIVGEILELRDIEKSLRNPVAHNITNVSLNMIKEYSVTEKKPQGYTPKEIFEIMKKLVVTSGISVSKDSLNTYDALNDEIERRL